MTGAILAVLFMLLVQPGVNRQDVDNTDDCIERVYSIDEDK